MKLTCIIDADSYRHLDKIQYKRKSVLEWLYETLKVHFSPQVYSEIGNPTRRNKYVLKPIKYKMAEYERRLFGTILPSTKGGNKGERDNFIISIDQSHHLKIVGIVFLTDDENARRGNLVEWLPSFPVILIWSSYDVVLYLYAERKISEKQYAVEVLLDLDNQINPDTTERTPETTEKKEKRLNFYLKKIENIDKLS